MARQWQGSTRSAELPGDWKRRRARILKRDPICTRCRTARSTEVHHAIDRNDHRYVSLAGICTPCHKLETQAEARAARPSRYRTPAPHPGLNVR